MIIYKRGRSTHLYETQSKIYGQTKPFFVRNRTPIQPYQNSFLWTRHLFAHVIAPLVWEFPNSEFPAAEASNF